MFNTSGSSAHTPNEFIFLFWLHLSFHYGILVFCSVIYIIYTIYCARV